MQMEKSGFLVFTPLSVVTIEEACLQETSEELYIAIKMWSDVSAFFRK